MIRNGIMLGLALVALCACGKYGPNSQPGPPDKIIYPKIYPTQ
jgi:predicted small lipoprotein YifL